MRAFLPARDLEAATLQRGNSYGLKWLLQMRCPAESWQIRVVTLLNWGGAIAPFYRTK